MSYSPSRDRLSQFRKLALCISSAALWAASRLALQQASIGGCERFSVGPRLNYASWLSRQGCQQMNAPTTLNSQLAAFTANGSSDAPRLRLKSNGSNPKDQHHDPITP
jgi:hypothetical protein